MLIQNSIHTLINIARAYEAAAFRGNEADRLMRLRGDLTNFQRDLLIDLSAIGNFDPKYGDIPYFIAVTEAKDVVAKFPLSGWGLREALLYWKREHETNDGLPMQICIQFGDDVATIATDRIGRLLAHSSHSGQFRADCDEYLGHMLSLLRDHSAL